MTNTSPFTEEGMTRLRNYQKRMTKFILGWIALGIFSGGAYLWYSYHTLLPLQSLYFRQYAKSILRSAIPLKKKPAKYTLLVRTVTDQTTGKDVEVGVNDSQVAPVLDANGRPMNDPQKGPAFTLNAGVPHHALYWTGLLAEDSRMNAWLSEHIYGGAGLLGFLIPSGLLALGVAVVGGVGTAVVDKRINREYEEGHLVRGTRKLTPAQYSKTMKRVETGVGVWGIEVVPPPAWKEKVPDVVMRTGRQAAQMIPAPIRRMKPKSRGEIPYWLSIPRWEEQENFILLGDPGTGKTQLMHYFLYAIARRARPFEPVVIYDPACQFLKWHFNAARGDIILNPVDERCPYWSPVRELRYVTDRGLLAEAFFPGAGENANGTSKFFTDAARSIFKLILGEKLSPAAMVEILRSAERLDRLTKDTESAHYLDHGAGNQRGGVLASLAEAADTLKLLPPDEEARDRFTLTDWARQRSSGWIFITSKPDMRDDLARFHATLINILIKRLMSVEEDWGTQHPCWLFVDEVHALKHLPALHNGLAEGRKYGLKIVMGTHSKNDFEQYYGRLARKMIALPHTKIVFRTNEPENARWVADMIGDQETEKPRVGTTASVEDRGRDSINYQTVQEKRPVFSKEEVMGLAKMHACWKYEDRVVPFRFKVVIGRQVTEGFVPRPDCIEQPIPQPEEEREPEQPEQKRTGTQTAKAGAKTEHDSRSEAEAKDTNSPAASEAPAAKEAATEEGSGSATRKKKKKQEKQQAETRDVHSPQEPESPPSPMLQQEESAGENLSTQVKQGGQTEMSSQRTEQEEQQEEEPSVGAGGGGHEGRRCSGEQEGGETSTATVSEVELTGEREDSTGKCKKLPTTTSPSSSSAGGSEVQLPDEKRESEQPAQAKPDDSKEKGSNWQPDAWR